MKKLSLLTILTFVFFACQKEPVLNVEIPKWLKDNIEKEERIIKDSPKSLNSWGAWMRFKWQNEFYYEYHNVLSSSLPIPISSSGDSLHIYTTDANTDYYKEKCCREYVWKAPRYDELPGI